MNIKVNKNKLKLNMDSLIYVIMKEEYFNDDESQFSYVEGYFLRENEAINHLLDDNFTEELDDFKDTAFYIKNNGHDSCIACIIKLENMGQREFNFPLKRKLEEEI